MNFPLNLRQIKKELRPLFAPWALSVVAGGLMAALRPFFEGSGAEGLVVGLAIYGYLGGLGLVATTAFGLEMHERTLGLLLSQPVSRSVLWAHKMVALMVAILAAVVAEALVLSCISGWHPGDEIRGALREIGNGQGLVLAGMFLWVTACSCTFWTLLAGSTIGGFVFTIAGQFVATLAVSFAVSRIQGQDELFKDAQTVPALIATGLVYSIVFLGLGWWRFVKLEVRASGLGAGEGSGLFSWSGPWSRWLKSRPTSKVLNLVRKELRLQKPIFQIAAGYVICWLATLILQWLRPRQDITYFFDIMTCLYAPVTSLLAGCVSLGEEKAMGLTGAQLVLPFSSWLQWLIKLIVCAVVAAVLSLVLPLLLFWTTGALENLGASGLVGGNKAGMSALAVISGLMFLLGYWAISLTSNTVRAALVAICGVIALPALAAVGMQCANACFGMRLPGRDALALTDTAVAAVVLMLGQSAFQFRKSEERKPKLVFCFATLAGLILFFSFWATCFG